MRHYRYGALGARVHQHGQRGRWVQASHVVVLTTCSSTATPPVSPPTAGAASSRSRSGMSHECCQFGWYRYWVRDTAVLPTVPMQQTVQIPVHSPSTLRSTTVGGFGDTVNAFVQQYHVLCCYRYRADNQRGVVRVWRANYGRKAARKHRITGLNERRRAQRNFNHQLTLCERIVCVVAFLCEIKLLLILFHYRKLAAVGVAW